MKLSIFSTVLCVMSCVFAQAATADELPFQHKVEVYRSKGRDVIAFTVRLEQPFLAEEFEQSNFLRLRSGDEQAYLIYPKQAKFHQKHAEFYGRLRGEGTVKLKLSYETVSENLDGSRRVQAKDGVVEVTIPELPGDATSIGSARIFQNWARQQNEHFARLLQYYPDETFFQYCLLQSKARYGVDPPPIPKRARNRDAVETDLYEIFTGSLAIQESLQRETLSSGSRLGDYNTHVSTLSPPRLRSLDYKKLLEEKLERDKVEPQVHEISKLVPADQYLLHFNSMKSMGEALDLASDWGDNLLRLYTVQAQDNRLQEKFEEQLCLRRGALEELFTDGVIKEVALTGADPFLLEGTDLTVIFRVAEPPLFQKEAGGWLADTRGEHPDLVERDFNYRGHKVNAYYTNDRVVSSFSVRHKDYFVYSNSHRSIRRIIDASISEGASLHDALDYRYISTLLPPSSDENSGYLFASEAFIKRLVGPAAKISQKRRLQCFNNLVMQNNASLLYRLEYGRSPESLSELIEGRFVDADKIVCPHGGAYAFDADRDTCTCSLHNRLKYLTPNIELPVLNVSEQESTEYGRYKQRYQQFWQKTFDPIAIRITVDPSVKLETCVLPFANSSLYNDLRDMVDKNAQPLDTARIAPSAVFSYAMVPGRENTAEYLKLIPGVAEVVKDDPTLTDMNWIGDRVSLHFCDGETILEIDPTQLRTLKLPLVGETSTSFQAMIGSLLLMANMPVYATVDVENREKGEQLIQQFSERIFLKEGNLAGLSTKLDAYRLPDYKKHAIYVLNLRLYAVSLRLHISLVGDQLILATKPEVLREVIDVSTEEPSAEPPAAHMLLRLNHRALDRLYDNVQLFWAEKSRVACHRNIISVYNFHKLYNAPIDEIPELSEAKYGVRYYCPDNGDYAFDKELNQVVCSVHGNREHSRQNPHLDRKSSFAQFIHSLDELTATLRFQDDALIATLEIQRNKGGDDH